MNSLTWRDSPPEEPARGKTRPPSNPWFPIAVGLMGLIAGFSLGRFTHGGPVLPPDVPAAVQPPPAAVPAPPAAPTAAKPVPPVDPAKDRIRGDLSKATVAVLEYSDFECP